MGAYLQAEVNIGMVGHVDHGKTSLTKALTGKWTDTHSEELKRGITIKIGYADTAFYRCEKCSPDAYGISEKCEKCKGPATLLRNVSFLDAPGHETLMTTTIAASSILDGALLVIAANEKCPQPQSLEHLMVLDILGIKNIVVVQNKIDLVPAEKAVENYKQIKEFLKGSVAENAPIIPISANYKSNIDILIKAIEEHIKTPKRDASAAPKMYIARSFDINKPGTAIAKLAGGVLGGSLMQGELSVGDSLEIRPGISKKSKDKETIEPIIVKISALAAGSSAAKTAKPGGLIGIGTHLDPALTKSDSLTGNLVGKPGTLPPVLSEISLEYTLLKREGFDNPALKMGEPLVVSVGTATTIGVIVKLKGSSVFLKLKRAICAEKKSRVAICRRMGQRWRLAGFGKLN
ncbi:translation initiation factor IF-2 subunit gamma [Candidatus Micrarchaeota archaeon]|nr:translation initiation factor IF-2 subunit gamma [Candidatus Micrarchaeota archaeon]